MKPTLDPASFRDPDGAVFSVGRRIYRRLGPDGRRNLEPLIEQGILRELESARLAVETRVCDPEEAGLLGFDPGQETALEHERVPYLSYPYEWSFEMLRTAALTHLEIMERLVPKGFILKDSTAYNYQFIGSRCVLIDIPSIERRHPKDPWMGYTQFCRHFLNPLLIHSLLRVSPHPMIRGQLEGIPVEEAHALIPFWKQFRAGAWLHVGLQAALSKRSLGGASERSLFQNLPDQGEVILATVRKLVRLIRRLPNPRQQTVWTDYERTHSYSESGRQAKRAMLTEVVARAKPSLVYDLGANTGEYSLLAAEHAGYVVALDSDASAVDRLYQRLKGAASGKVLPILMDLANPSPDQGFAGVERRSFANREHPDFVVAFALVHHLRISGNIPVASMLDWFRSLGAAQLLVEFVPKQDPMVCQLLKNREDVYPDYTAQVFERECAARFRIVERKALPEGGREIFHLEARRDSPATR